MTTKFVLPILAAGLLAAAPALAAADTQSQAQNPPPTQKKMTPDKPYQNSSDLKDALDEVRESTTVVKKMEGQPEMPSLLNRARAVFIVPDYGRGALGVGASGGQGLLLARKTDGSWGDPVFYDIGSISLGVQAGASAGQVAMLLMTDRAVNSFKGNNTFSLNADAGLTIVNYSARGQASIGKGDVIVWADTEGAYAGVSVSASDITADEEANRAYYGQANVSPSAVLSGTISKARPEASALKDALGEA